MNVLWLDKWTVSWTENWLNGQGERVVMSNTMSSWRTVTSIVPQGSVLGLIPFNIIFIDQDCRTECTLSKFAVHTKQREETDIPYIYIAIQSDLNELEKQADNSLMMLKKRKCKVLCLGVNNLMHQHRLGDDELESSFAEQMLGGLVDTKLTMSQ